MNAKKEKVFCLRENQINPLENIEIHIYGSQQHLKLTFLAQGLKKRFFLLFTLNLMSNTVSSLNTIHKLVYNYEHIHVPPVFYDMSLVLTKQFSCAFVKKKDNFSAPVAICKRKISNLQGKILQSVQLLIFAFFLFCQLYSIIPSFIIDSFVGISFKYLGLPVRAAGVRYLIKVFPRVCWKTQYKVWALLHCHRLQAPNQPIRVEIQILSTNEKLRWVSTLMTCGVTDDMAGAGQIWEPFI